MQRVLGKPGEPTLGCSNRLEQGGMRAGTQHVQAMRFSDTGTEQLEPERSGREEGDSDRVTKHKVREGGGTGGGAPRLAARER